MIDKFRHELENITYIHLKKDLSSGDIVLKKDIPYPVLGEKEASLENFVEGMLKLFGIHDSFSEKKEYASIIQALEKKDQLVSRFVFSKVNEPKHALILGLGLIHLGILREDILLFCGECANTIYTQTEDSDYRMMALELFTRGKNEYDCWQFSYHLGIDAFNNNHFSKAIEFLSHALGTCAQEEFIEQMRLTIQVSYERLDFEKGKKLFSKDRYEEAITVFESLRENNDQWYDLYFYLGLSYRCNEDYKKAILYFERALALKQQTQSYLQLGMVYLLEENFQKAFEVYKEAENKGFANHEIYCNLSIAEYFLGETKKAVEDVKISLKQEPEDPIAKKWLGIYEAH